MKRAPHDPAAATVTARHPMALPRPDFARPRSGTRHRLMLSVILTMLAWTGVGVFQAVPDMFRSFDRYVFVSHLIENWTWGLLTPAVLLIDRKLKSLQPNVAKLLLVYLPLSIPFTLVHAYLAGLLLYPMPEIWWNPLRNPTFAIYFFLGGCTTYFAFVGFLQAFNFYNRFLTSEKRLIESRLNALRLQLEPHFLFNALNAISSKVTTDPELVEEMIENLGTLLRQSMECHASTEITLAQELALLDHYLAIQKLRFGDRIALNLKTDPAALSIKVPSLLLQPLVENAVRHGIERRRSGGSITISARLVEGHLQIRVADDGVGLPPDWSMESSSGLGLRVTRERLEGLYGRAGDRFVISRRPGGGTEVIIRIPFQGTGVESDGHQA
jgi:signal transduction histidine kinase